MNDWPERLLANLYETAVHADPKTVRVTRSKLAEALKNAYKAGRADYKVAVKESLDRLP